MLNLNCFNITHQISSLSAGNVYEKMKPTASTFHWPSDSLLGSILLKMVILVEITMPISMGGIKNLVEECVWCPTSTFLPPKRLPGQTDITDYIDPNVTLMAQKLRVSHQNGVSEAWYIVQIHHSGQEPSKLCDWFKQRLTSEDAECAGKRRGPPWAAG